MSSSDPRESLADIHAQEFMEEDLKDQELRELDLGSMEDACTRNSFYSIPARQIQLLQEALVKSKVQNKLGVYHLTQKDKQKMPKENRKRGHKTDLQQLNRLGNALVKLG